MSEIFKCGDIANIINKNIENKINKKGDKKRSKLSKKFGKIIKKKNKDKVIKIKKSQDFTVEPSNDETIDDNNELFNQEEDDEDVPDITEMKVDKQKRSNRSSVDDPIEKKERTVFVGNLPQNVTSKVLNQMFSQIGPIDSIRLRGAVPQKEKMSKRLAIITKSFHSGTDNIIAFVVFKSKDDVLKAIKLNGTEVDGHRIRVDRIVKDNYHDNLRSVFIGNLPFVVKDDDLYEFFKDCGDIEAVRVVRDKNTGVGKGFGFILFKSKDSVILALEKNEMKFSGRDIRVTRAKGHQNNDRNKTDNRFKSKKTQKHIPNETEEDTEKVEKKFKKSKKSISKPEFEGISAKKIKKKSNKKKEFLSIRNKKQQKKLAQIFSH